MRVRRGWITRLRVDKVAQYRALHSEPWPEIIALLGRAGISDYTIWLHEPEGMLFSSFVYSGSDFDADMAIIADDPVAQRWHALTGACQIAMGADDAPWAPLVEVFRLN